MPQTPATKCAENSETTFRPKRTTTSQPNKQHDLGANDRCISNTRIKKCNVYSIGDNQSNFISVFKNIIVFFFNYLKADLG